MRSLGYRIIDMIVEHITTLNAQPGIAPTDRAAMEAALREPIPDAPSSMDTIIAQFERDIIGNLYRKGHPRDFAFVPNPNNYISVLADTLARGFNIFGG
ncbi:MAG: decarboxylase, partial [Chloroflexi bacterium]